MQKAEAIPVSVDMIEEAAAYLGASESLSFRKESEHIDSKAFSLVSAIGTRASLCITIANTQVLLLDSRAILLYVDNEPDGA